MTPTIEKYVINEKNNEKSIIIKIDNFLNIKEQNFYLQKLKMIKNWHGGSAFNRKIARLQRWYHTYNKSLSNKWKYNYERWKCNSYEDWLFDLQNRIEKEIQPYFTKKLDINSVLINLYRNGNDNIRHHRDKLFGENPIVIGLSLGETRTIKFRRVIFNEEIPVKMKTDKKKNYLNKEFELKSGTLFIMAGSTQKYYSHGIDRDSSKNPRYSLTFRKYN
jgi:alkylated DNA repair dioxygenase AlkB